MKSIKFPKPAKADKNKQKLQDNKKRTQKRSQTKIPAPKKEYQDKAKIHKHKKLLKICLPIAFIISLLALGFSIYCILKNVTIAEEISEVETIAYTTEYIDDNSLEMGAETIEQAGVNGAKRKYFEIKKTLLDNEVKTRRFLRSETITEPTKSVVRRGTRKWQYMYCSDGSYRFYYDEDFAKPNVGFTHASRDVCAENGQGTMTALGDVPPQPTSTPYTPSYSAPYNPIYSYNEYTPPSSESNYSPDASTDNNAVNKEAEDLARQQAYLTAKNRCQDQASQTYRNVMSQLGAMGVSGSDAQARNAMNQTYNNCMAQAGY